MKKILLIVAIFVFNILQVFSNENLKSGDSLAILYYRVWAYKNPADLTSRMGPYSYFDKKMVFIGERDTLADYYLVNTPDGNEAFIKKSRVSSDQMLSHQQIKQEIREGKRFKNPNDLFKSSKSEFPWWKTLSIFLIILVLLYFLWKYFYEIDLWFCRISKASVKPINQPWFITYSLILGFVIGSIQQFFAPTETAWFFSDGLLLWADFPSFWDWILWGDLILISMLVLAGIGQAFYRFPPLFGFLYSILTIILVVLYFTVGIVTGGLALVILLIKLFLSGSGGGEAAYDSSGRQIGTFYRN